MIKHITRAFFATLFALASAAAIAAVDANTAGQAELEAVKGIGTSTAARMLEERKKSPFKDWADLIDRVKGVGPGNAAKFSAAGLTVGKDSFSGASVEAATQSDKKPAKVAKAAAPAAAK